MLCLQVELLCLFVVIFFQHFYSNMFNDVTADGGVVEGF